MNGINRVTLLGNLTADPELGYTQGGQAVLNLRMATSSSYKDKDGQFKERTEYHSVKLWGARGEKIATMLSRGSRLYVEGELRTSSYEKNGEKRYSTEVVCTDIHFFSGGAPEGKPAGGKANASNKKNDRREHRSDHQDPNPPAEDYGFDEDDIPF